MARPVIKVIKIGGNVIDSPEALHAFIKDFARLEGPKILVHGGGKEATRLSTRLGIETSMIDGRRVTDADTINVCTMVYAGLINKRIVAMLQAEGCDAIGLSGADAGLVKASKRPAAPIDYGFVGDISNDGVRSDMLDRILIAGLTPVFCAIMHDGSGQLLNCNADSVASAVAVGCSSFADTELCFCFEKDGVMTDVNDPSSVVRVINHGIFEKMREDGTVNSGMIPKIDNALRAISSGVSRVVIKNSCRLLEDSGTMITTGGNV